MVKSHLSQKTFSRRKKSKASRVERELKARAPQVVENVKKCLFMKGNKTTPTVTGLMDDLYMLKKPDAKKFQRNNDIHPFQDTSSLQFLSDKNDSAFVVLVNNQKKRPNNMVMIRNFNYEPLDMFEFEVENYKPMINFTTKARFQTKPGFIFIGDEFDREEKHMRFKNYMIDFYRGQVVDAVHLAGLDSVVVCTAVDGKIALRGYCVVFLDSGGKLPRVELEPMGPHADLTFRRTKLANHEELRTALRQPRQLSERLGKNIKRDEIGNKVGRIYTERQDMNTMQVKKMKALKKRTNEEKNGEPAAKRSKDE
eukprot:TRINITY_DN776184_c0_g1_i1.p1 TRINITY_DN776184_c0_g1~~TRINITY_DN776184_c0_g1_i1.p1  ORF type:complete len:311 (-),score=77.30 TRINITY_DN776184_c0_g1_i1:243-1175(-)